MDIGSIIVIGALGWYLRGQARKKAAKSSARKVPPIADLPRPPGPGGAEGATGPDPDAWADLGFDVEVYPPGMPYENLAAPPSNAAGITWSDGCEVIVVGDQWWDRVGDYVNAAIEADPNVSAAMLAAAVVQSEGLDACDASSPGYGELRAEIQNRIREVLSNESLDLSVVSPMSMLTPEEIEFGEGVHIYLHHRVNVGNHKIAVAPAGSGFRWWLFRPIDVELTQAGAFDAGAAPNQQLALHEAKLRADSYTAVVGNRRRPRRNRRRMVLW